MNWGKKKIYLLNSLTSLLWIVAIQRLDSNYSRVKGQLFGPLKSLLLKKHLCWKCAFNNRTHNWPLRVRIKIPVLNDNLCKQWHIFTSPWMILMHIMVFWWRRTHYNETHWSGSSFLFYGVLRTFYWTFVVTGWHAYLHRSCEQTKTTCTFSIHASQCGNTFLLGVISVMHRWFCV